MTTTSSTGSTSTGSTSATASIISQLNAGSGIDTGALVDQLVAAQFATKEDQLTAKGDMLTAEISAVGQLQSDISSFASALSSLIKSGSLQTSPTSSNSGILTVTGQPGAKLAGLSAQLEVDQLATAQSAATGLVADPTAAIGGGTLTLTFGTATVADGQMTGFTAGADSPVDIAIDPAHSSLQDIAKAINAADAGVTATVVGDAGGARLMLKGATGADKAFTLTATEDPTSPGLSALDIGVGASGTTIGSAAQDALVTLDGVQFRRSSNSFSDLISGVEVNLVSAQPGTIVSIGSSRPTASLSEAVTDFVDTYNQMIAEVNSETDAKSGDLKQDTAAKNLKAMLSQLTLTKLVSSSDPDAPTTLAEIGVGTNRDGTLSVDPEQLSKALAQWPDQIEAMFADVTGTSVSLGPSVVATGRGLLGALKSISESAGSSVYGLDASLKKYQKAQDDLADQSDTLARQKDATRTRLTQQFATMDAMVSSYKSTQTFLQQQIDAWNGKND